MFAEKGENKMPKQINMKHEEIHYTGHIGDLRIEQYGAEVIIRGSAPYEFYSPDAITELDTLQTEIEGLEEDLEEQEYENSNLVDKVENQEYENDKLVNKIEKLEQDIEDLETEIRGLKVKHNLI